MIFTILISSSIRSHSIISKSVLLAQSEHKSTDISKDYSTDLHIQQMSYFLTIF